MKVLPGAVQRGIKLVVLIIVEYPTQYEEALIMLATKINTTSKVLNDDDDDENDSTGHWVSHLCFNFS